MDAPNFVLIIVRMMMATVHVEHCGGGGGGGGGDLSVAGTGVGVVSVAQERLVIVQLLEHVITRQSAYPCPTAASSSSSSTHGSL